MQLFLGDRQSRSVFVKVNQNENKYWDTNAVSELWGIVQNIPCFGAEFVWSQTMTKSIKNMSCSPFSLSWNFEKFQHPLSGGHRSRLSICQAKENEKKYWDGNAVNL